ncbi:MAG: GDP-mannose 4,6-dehydratase [Sphingobacteriales bacterium]|nr:GDP-mannose 4,6-dehydratase [Sphingobacteriales bacterium]
MNHIIITGGAGFIGSNLIKTLFNTRSGIRITCIDNFDPFYSADIKQLNIRDFKSNPDFHFIYSDIATTTPIELNELIEEPVNVIAHIAARAGVRPSIQDPLSYQQSNVIGTQNLLEFARQRGVKQFVFASSSSVYGLNDHLPWKEDEQLLPISPYAMTKQAGEMLGHVYSRLFGIRFLALRLFTVYGPGQRPDLAIHKFIKAILKGEPVTMYGDGSTSRDYTYVDDVVHGIINAMNYDSTSFEIINIGNNHTVSLKELVIAIEEVCSKKAMIEQLPEQQGDLQKTFADISKAKKLLGYNPGMQLKDGLKKFYDWFLQNQEILMNA